MRFCYCVAPVPENERLLFILTLKYSGQGGVPMDPKISFRALAQKRKVIGRSPSLT